MRCGQLHRTGAMLLAPGTADGQFLQFGSIWVPSNWALPTAADAGETGEVLQLYDGVTFTDPFGHALLYRNGCNSLGVADVWLHQWTYATVAVTTKELAGFAVALRSGTLKYMRVFHGTIATADPLTYVLVKNGVDTALTVSLNAASNGPASNLVDTVPVTEGDLLSVRVDGATGSRSTRTGVNYLLEY